MNWTEIKVARSDSMDFPYPKGADGCNHDLLQAQGRGAHGVTRPTSGIRFIARPILEVEALRMPREEFLCLCNGLIDRITNSLAKAATFCD